jgi:hypothetical protein
VKNNIGKENLKKLTTHIQMEKFNIFCISPKYGRIPINSRFQTTARS